MSTAKSPNERDVRPRSFENRPVANTVLDASNHGRETTPASGRRASHRDRRGRPRSGLGSERDRAVPTRYARPGVWFPDAV